MVALWAMPLAPASGWPGLSKERNILCTGRLWLPSQPVPTVLSHLRAKGGSVDVLDAAYGARQSSSLFGQQKR